MFNSNLSVIFYFNQPSHLLWNCLKEILKLIIFLLKSFMPGAQLILVSSYMYKNWIQNVVHQTKVYIMYTTTCSHYRIHYIVLCTTLQQTQAIIHPYSRHYYSCITHSPLAVYTNIMFVVSPVFLTTSKLKYIYGKFSWIFRIQVIEYWDSNLRPLVSRANAPPLSYQVQCNLANPSVN